MAKLEEILDEWDKDSVVDETKLGHESSRNPMIHAKYIRMLATTKLQLRKAESSYLTTRKLYYRYYKGELTKQELLELQWNQYQGKILLKSEMDEFLSTNESLIKLTDKIAYFTTMKESLESILKSIASRTWDIKTSVEYMKIQNGLM